MASYHNGDVITDIVDSVLVSGVRASRFKLANIRVIYYAHTRTRTHTEREREGGGVGGIEGG